ncbi:MAG: FAD-dependent oxidoreductase [Vicinamibacteria bacterium]
MTSLRVGVIGSGISGLAAAHYLARHHRVTLFEAESRLGGHAHTHDVELEGRRLRVDTGFIVYNHRTYPRFVALLAELGVAGRESDMSFGVRCRRCGLEYSSRGPAGLFAQRRRVLDPSHLRLLADIPRFNRDARALLARPGGDALTLGGFLDRGGYSRGFVRHFVLPMGGAIWSAPFGDIRAFPARSFLRFFDNHGWLRLTGVPRWWTVAGGSRTYVDAIARGLGGRILTGRPVEAVRRTPGGVVASSGGREWTFDRIVVATHADQALRLLADADEDERRLLGAFRYSRNRAVLHADRAALPRARDAWASWNSDLADCRDDAAPVSLTYHLSRLQGLPGPDEICVTLNPAAAPRRVLATIDYAHPILDGPALAAQHEIARRNGARNTFFAGAHLRYGFHEDGLASAIAVAERLGVRVLEAVA